jgi:hypothetical protein
MMNDSENYKKFFENFKNPRNMGRFSSSNNYKERIAALEEKVAHLILII